MQHRLSALFLFPSPGAGDRSSFFRQGCGHRSCPLCQELSPSLFFFLSLFLSDSEICQPEGERRSLHSRGTSSNIPPVNNMRPASYFLLTCPEATVAGGCSWCCGQLHHTPIVATTSATSCRSCHIPAIDLICSSQLFQWAFVQNPFGSEVGIPPPCPRNLLPEPRECCWDSEVSKGCHADLCQ